jgi:hypothetical protein
LTGVERERIPLNPRISPNPTESCDSARGDE